MLPDYPEIKIRINAILLKRMRQIIRGAQFENVNRQRVFEGNLGIIRRPDGTEEKISYTLFRSGFELKIDDIANITQDKVIEHIDTMAYDLAKQNAKYAIETIEKGIKQAGNSVNHQELTAETILEVIEMSSIDFRLDGTPIMPTLYIHPSAKESVTKLIDKIKNTPKYNKQMNDILTQKKEDWRVRESNRKLVG